MKTLFKNGKIYNPSDDTLLEADLLVDGEQIVKKEKNIKDDADRVVDASGSVLMPGFKNAHSHSAMTLLRSIADDMNLEDWLEKKIFPAERKMTADDVYLATIVACMEYVKNGITACQDMYFHQEASARAFNEFGFRANINGSLTDGDYDPYERILRESEKYYKSSSLVSYAIGVHSTYTCSKKTLQAVSKALKVLKRPFYLHMNETKYEADNALKRTGMYNAFYADSLSLFDYGGAVYHGVHMQDVELDILKKRNIGIVLNPCSNAKLNSGMVDFERYTKKGVVIGMGTDGASSNNSLDMFKELWTFYAVNHIKYNTTVSPKPADILKTATIGSARIMCLENSDVLEVGKNADIVMIDICDVNAMPFTDFAKYICYSANPTNVLLTMIAGKIVYENGKYAFGVDKKELFKDMQKSLNRIIN